MASLSISGLISTGKLSASGIDTTLLLILSILETIGYLYGLIALSSGGAQTSGLDQLLDGNGEGLRGEQGKALGRRWLKQIQKNQEYNLGDSLFDDDHSDLRISPVDISRLDNHKSNKHNK